MARRISASTTPDGYRLTIKAKRFWPLTIFGSIWLFTWLASGVVGLATFLADRADRPPMFVVLLAPLVWAVIGLPYSYFVLWPIAGKEILTVSGGSLAIKRDIFGLGRTRRYDIAQIQNLRARGLFGSFYTWSGMMRSSGLSGGVVAFDYLGKAQAFGVHLEEDEARQVVQHLQPHLR